MSFPPPPRGSQASASPNPLLASTSGFSIADSFGPQPALIVPSTVIQEVKATTAATKSPSISTVSSTSSLASLGPPQPGVFLLPSSTGAGGLTAPPPTSTTSNFSLGPGRKTRYAPPPGINSSPTSSGAPTMIPSPLASGTFPSTTMPPAFIPATPVAPSASEELSPFVTTEPTLTTTLKEAEHNAQMQVSEMAFHWFYRKSSEDTTGSATNSSEKAEGASQLQFPFGQPRKLEVWKPFTMIDSTRIEDAYGMGSSSNESVSVDGGRYDVNISQRTKIAIYWAEEPIPIRRCSWFYKSNSDGRWNPYDEDTAKRLEAEYCDAVTSGRWNRRVELNAESNNRGEYITLHSPAAMMHFPSSSALSGNVDDWGQVQPQDPQIRPRVVHRGLEGLPEIPDGESEDIDHLVFVVHGIGAACDIKFRSITEVVDGFRELSEELSEKHFQSAQLMGKVNRVEFLPINWHTTLHGEDTGTDKRLKPLTLKSIPKLRSFVNDTLLDILFYTSPLYCQTILNTVVSEINRIYTLFMARNENFSGAISVMGHSLGSLILFDVLSNQSQDEEDLMKQRLNSQAPAPESKTVSYQETSLEELFANLDISEYATLFNDQGITLADLLTSVAEEDLMEINLPLGARTKLLAYIERRNKKTTSTNNGTLTGLQEYIRSAVTSDVKYTVGPAGTGQPSVTYPALCFEPAAFYALGSPIGMFLAVRGIDSLGPNFSLPTCNRFFNIFHPYDPVAYRVESLINSELANLRPLVIPHHKGRKRMHLELKDTVTKLMTTDIKQTIIETVSSTFNAFYNMATGSQTETVQQALTDSMSKKADEADLADETNPRSLDSPLNGGRRIDHVLQEAPLESFNEYLFALASHLGYWESEDTCLLIIKDIYEGQIGVKCDEAQVLAAGSAAYNDLPPPAPVPTAILRPPPVAMGAPMSAASPTIETLNINRTALGPPISLPTVTPATPHATVESSVNNASTTLIASPGGDNASSGPPGTTPSMPKPSLFSTPDLGPPPPAQIPSSVSPISNLMGPPPSHNRSSPGLSAPPPLMMAPPTSTSPLLVANKGYPRPIRHSSPPTTVTAIPSLAGSNSVMGMDPTAPVNADRPVAPPPIGGFYTKK